MSRENAVKISCGGDGMKKYANFALHAMNRF